MCASSWPDHYLCDSSLASNLSNFQRFDFGSKLSDHSPLICSLHFSLSSPSLPPSVSPNFSNTRIDWSAVTSDEREAENSSLLLTSLHPFNTYWCVIAAKTIGPHGPITCQMPPAGMLLFSEFQSCSANYMFVFLFSQFGSDPACPLFLLFLPSTLQFP